MEATLLTSLHQRKSSPTAGKKQPKQRKKTKPIKVRYISNPMKVETCASKFRELVQELTGQDAADPPPEPATFPAAVPPLVPGTVFGTSPAVENLVPEGLANDQDDPEPFDPVAADRVPDYFEPLDGDVFVNQMVENFSGCFASGIYNVNALGSIDSA